MVGRACGLPEGQGVRPGTYCEPKMTSVGSQDTTGPMTRDELKDLACLGFSADLVMQSFCHTAAYPKPVDVKMHHELPDFISTRGGISLRPGDGIIHSWLNRMLLPDTVGTGGDSHTRFPIGISFPAGSGLVAFAAATGVMPLDMPEIGAGALQGQDAARRHAARPGQRDPAVRHQGGPADGGEEGQEEHLLRPHPGNRRPARPEGRAGLRAEPTPRPSARAAGCTVHLNKEPIIEYINSNITLMKWMIADGYADARTLSRRIKAHGSLAGQPAAAQGRRGCRIRRRDRDRPGRDHRAHRLPARTTRTTSRPCRDVAGAKIDEVFIGSCMTNIGHFRAACKLLEGKRDIPVKLWMAPPTKMDAQQLTEEGHYGVLGTAGARMEMPGCSLCMGNQAQVKEGATVFSTSTRNFPNRLGKNTNVYLGSAELAAICSKLGRIPTKAEYMADMGVLTAASDKVYKYLNFDQIEEFTENVGA